MNKTCSTCGDDVWAYFEEEWHPAKIYDLLPSGLLQVQWRDANISSMLDGLVARRGEHVQQGDWIIVCFLEEWYQVTAKQMMPTGAVEFFWDDGRTSEVPLLHTFRLPE